MKEPIFTYNETGGTYCIIKDGNKTFIGSAQCHPEDMPFCNRRVGEQIAITRAYIEYLKYLRDDVRKEIQTLKHFYSCISMHKQFDKKNFIVKSLLRTINKLELELTGINSELKQEKNGLKFFVNDKNQLYRILEKRRENK